jgi:hypothetical protein
MGATQPQETGGSETRAGASADNSAGHVLKNILGSTLEQQTSQIYKLRSFWEQKLAEGIPDVTTKALIALTIEALQELLEIRSKELKLI